MTVDPTMAGIRQALNHRGLSQFEQWWLLQQAEQAMVERDQVIAQIGPLAAQVGRLRKAAGREG